MSTFFTYEERLTLQKYLKESRSFKQIAKSLGKDPSTISREVRKHMLEVTAVKAGKVPNSCTHRPVCKKKNVCGSECTRGTPVPCHLCRSCNEHCSDFVEEVCMNRFHPPYVCNGCENLDECLLRKYMYDAEKAHLASHARISSSRSGICSSEEELARLNRIITPLAKQGQSIHQIYVNHQDEIMCSEKTIYNYIDAGLLDVKNIDLPRRVRFRAKRTKPEFKVDKGCRLERNYADFHRFMADHPDNHLVQMDTVIGTQGGKCLLTIHFVEFSFMLAFLRDANTSKSVIDVFNWLYYRLGHKLFCRLFPVILTDNGSEFSNPKAIEFESKYGYRRTHIFYCDAGKPYQKGAFEVNHELIRRILPKGKSFDKLTQQDVSRMMDHINSYKRQKLNNRTPYETFSFHFGSRTLELLGCSPVAADDIRIKSSLLR